jgi:DegV family protein with EDD domain
MAIRIITDSTSDIALERQEELEIEIIPLSVRFGKEEYLDGVDLTKQQFYEKLAAASELPTTAQINPERFVKIFSQYPPEDEIIGIFISGRMSGTYQSAGIAKNLLGAQNIYLVDSRAVTFGLGLLVLEAVRMRDEGCSAKEIYEKLEALKPRMRFYAVIGTLKYLKMGGRLSASSALFGAMLQIKPIVTFRDGEVLAIEKRKGMKAAIEWITESVLQDPPDEKRHILLGDSIAPDVEQMLRESLSKHFDLSGSVPFELGSVVGTHAGPGCAGVAYISKNNPYGG